MSNLSVLNPTPHATAVYASCSALLPPHATLASRRPATALPGPDLHRLIAPALAGAFLLDHLVGAGDMPPEVGIELTRLMPCGVTYHEISRDDEIECGAKGT